MKKPKIRDFTIIEAKKKKAGPHKNKPKYIDETFEQVIEYQDEKVEIHRKKEDEERN